MQNFMMTLLFCSVSMAAIGLIYMAAQPLLARHYSAKWRYYAWLIIVIGLIIPFRPQFNTAVVSLEMPSAPAPSPMFAPEIATLVQMPEIAVATAPSINIWAVVVAVWLAGIAVFVAFHAFRHWWFLRMVRRWSSPMKWPILEPAGGRLPPLRVCPMVASPMLVGIFRPKIILPTLNLTQKEFEFIIKHELVHHRRKDVFFKCLVLFATAIHWFNPIVWLFAKNINSLCEASCDEEVLQNAGMDARQAYTETIIGVAKYQSNLKANLATNFYGGKKDMKNRISLIMNGSKKKTGAIIACAVLAATISTGVVFAANEPASADTAVEQATDLAFPEGVMRQAFQGNQAQRGRCFRQDDWGWGRCLEENGRGWGLCLEQDAQGEWLCPNFGEFRGYGRCRNANGTQQRGRWQ